METDNEFTQHSARKLALPPALQRLISEDAVGQLRRQDGLMATLGSEDGTLKLDWVEAVTHLLDDSSKLEEVEAEARAIRDRGIRHILWAGMGGSIIAVRVFTELGFCNQPDKQHITIYPLDSTDPAALNEIVSKLAETKGLPLTTLPDTKTAATTTLLHTLLEDVMMIGVSMGMTSEEPITHLIWFSELLEQAQLSAAEHLLVMTLPDSYLDRFAHEHQVSSLPLQLDGRTGTGGRMSAPTTRVFLLPAALYLTRSSQEGGQLRRMLNRAWRIYNLALATEHPAEHLFVQLAAALSDASVDGACRMLLNLPQGWSPTVQWIEQLLEESLGKDGKGIVVFANQTLNANASKYSAEGMLAVHIVTEPGQLAQHHSFNLSQPYLADHDPVDRLAALAASFLGWQLAMALYGYLHHIPFAGQPAVENYKARAHTLRTQSDPFQTIANWQATITDGPLTLLAPQKMKTEISPSSVFASTLQQFASPGYLDLTINGEPSAHVLSIMYDHLSMIGNQLLGVPVKLRRAPAAYHSTEQSEMDGPPYLVSLRIVTRDHEEAIIGNYTDTFLCAQAVSTWQAMIEQERSCFLCIFHGSMSHAAEPLHHFFTEVEQYVREAWK